MMTVPAWIVGALAALAVGLLGYYLFIAENIAKDRLARSLQRVTHEEPLLKERSDRGQELLAAGLDLGENAETKFTLIRLGLAGVTFILVGATIPPIMALAAVGVAFMAPAWYVAGRKRSRAQAMDRELPDALGRIAGLLEIQPDIAQVLALTADSLSVGGRSPLADELRRTAAEFRSRGEEALRDLERRAPTPGLASLAAALRIYAQAGGQFSAVMSAAADRASALWAGRNEGLAKAGSALMAAKIIPGMLAFVGFFTLRDPDVQHFYRSGFGQILAVVVIGAMIYGYLMIRSMVDEVM